MHPASRAGRSTCATARPRPTVRSRRDTGAAHCGRRSIAASYGKTDVRVTVRDNAGNELTGVPARFRITSVTSGRLRAHVRKGGRVRVKPDAGSRSAGQLVLSADSHSRLFPSPCVDTARRRAVPWVEASANVGANGRFVIRLAKGPARTASIAFPGRARRHACGAAAQAGRARVEFDPRFTDASERFGPRGCSGRVRGGAGRDLVVVLQGKEGGKWRTSRHPAPRTRPLADLVSIQRPARAAIRSAVRVRRQANLPYVTGYSKRVTCVG